MHKLRDAPGDTEEDLRSELEDVAGNGRVYVLGLGNTDRADDGAGVLVAQALKKRFPLFSYSEHDGVEGTVLDISEKKEDAVVIFVDAADFHASPGKIKLVRKTDIRDTEITTHRVAVALMASILERAGKRSAVLCIQPERIEFRGKVTKPVMDSVDLTTRILGAIMKNVNS
jgi:hydrogenase maturation protease